jgi:hypothetical protein
MARDLDLFVDDMLDDVIQRWMREEDFDPAWHRNECREPWVRNRSLPECTAYYNAQRRGAPGWQLGRLRGRCKERQFVRNLCLGRIARDGLGRVRRVPRSQWPNVNTQLAQADVRQGVRVLPRDPGSRVVDAVQGRLGPQGRSRGMRRLPEPALEHKSMWVPHYLRGGVLDLAGLQRRLRREVNQVQDTQRQANLPRGVRPGLPRRTEMVYSLDGLAQVPASQRPQLLQLVREIHRSTRRAGLTAHILRADA